MRRELKRAAWPVLHLDALARDPVVIGLVPCDEGLPYVVVPLVAVLVVRRVQVREVEPPETARELACVASDRVAGAVDQLGHPQLHAA